MSDLPGEPPRTVLADDTARTARELEWLRAELDAVWDLVGAPSARAGLGVLLERYGRQVDADGTALLFRDAEDAESAPRMQLRWRLYDGAEVTALEAFAARMHERDGRSVLRERVAGGRVLVGNPVRAGGEVSGVLCAVFDGEPAVSDDLLAQSGEVYAGLASLCLGSDRELVQLRERVGRDPLTGCLDRAAILDVLAEEIGRAERHGRRVACCMLDLDGFKGVNDRAGHLVGDQVLRTVAHVVRGGLRVYDRVGRYGGDEFLVVMPETPVTLACDAMTRIAGEIQAAGAAAGHRISAGAGVAGWQPGQRAEQLVARADRALLQAKATATGVVVSAGG